MALERIRRFLSPSVIPNEEFKARLTYRLNALSLVGIVITLVYSIGWLFIAPELSFRLILSVPMLILFGVVIILIRLNRVFVATNAFLGGVWLVVTLVTATAGGTRSPFFGFYPLVVLTAIIFSGWNTALFYGTLTLFTGLVMAHLANIGVIAEPFATPTSAWLTQAYIMIFLILDGYIIVHDVRRFVQRAQQALNERDKTEAALRASEERFRLIASITSDYTFSSRLNEQGELEHILLSGAFESITGYTPEEFLAIGGWRATLHPDDQAQDERDTAALHENQSVVTEMRVIKKGGSVRWVRVYAHPVWDLEQKRLIGINGGVQDITERKRAEEAVRQSEAHLRALLDATTDAAFLMARDGTLLTLNEALAQPMGQTVEQMMGQNGFDFLEPELRTQRYSHFEGVIQSGQPARWEDESPTGWWDNSVYPVLSATGSVEAFAIYSSDITERKRLEAELQSYTDQLERLVDERTNALRRAKEQLELILNTTTDALAFAQPNGDIVMTNPAFLAMFDEHAQRTIEGILSSVADDRQTEAICEALLRVIYDREGQRLEAQVVSEAKQEMDIDLTFTPVSISDNDSQNGVLLSGHDITQMKEIERFKARFVADAVHDLATPITGLITRVYLLKHTPEKLADHVRALENQIDHLHNLLEDLRTLSQIDRGQINLKMVMGNVNDLVKRVFDTYETVATHKQQSLRIHLDRTLPDIHLDQRQIERVLVNLISNAVNYTPEHKEINVETAIEGQAVIIRVADQGMGIKAEDLSHIFERFYRTDEARNSLSGGTGLGLAITKEIVERHGGAVTVTSELGQGSTFMVQLPLSVVQVGSS